VAGTAVDDVAGVHARPDAHQLEQRRLLSEPARGPRGKRIRVTPNVSSTIDEIDTFAEARETIAAGKVESTAGSAPGQ
jgi:hypothetical protein